MKTQQLTQVASVKDGRNPFKSGNENNEFKIIYIKQIFSSSNSPIYVMVESKDCDRG
jgi:hypothetical protein